MFQWIDKHKILVKLCLVLYIIVAGGVLHWYTSFELQYETRCDAQVLKVILDEGEDLLVAEAIACSVTKVLGPPTGHITLVTTVVAAGSGLLGFYGNMVGRIRRDE